MERTRNYGIDLLRLVSMFFVVMLHVLAQGGVLENASGIQYAISWYMEITAYCAVNCYALISGYVCYREEETPYNYAGYLGFWIPVFIYSFGITVAFDIFCPQMVGSDVLLKSALPVSSARYWYVNAYTGLFFIIPWLNKLLRTITEQQLNRLVLMLFIVFSVFPTFSNIWTDIFRMYGGYSLAWLVILYVVGAWVKKNKIDQKKRMFWWLIIIFICIGVTWAEKMPRGNRPSKLVSYMSFTMVIISLGMLVIFSRLKLSRWMISVVKIFSPAAFGVYLIHTQTLVWKYGLKDAFLWIAQSKAWLLPLEVLGCTLGIFVVCLITEVLRKIIFRKLGLDWLIKKIEERCNVAVGKLVCRICD